MSEWSVLDTLKVMREVVLEFGTDFAYTTSGSNSRCMYGPARVIDGKHCRCLIGEVLHRKGISDDALLSFDDNSVELEDILPEVGIADAAFEPLLDGQGQQDQGAKWGSAFAVAVNTAESEGLIGPADAAALRLPLVNEDAVT